MAFTYSGSSLANGTTTIGFTPDGVSTELSFHIDQQPFSVNLSSLGGPLTLVAPATITFTQDAIGNYINATYSITSSIDYTTGIISFSFSPTSPYNHPPPVNVHSGITISFVYTSL